MLSTFTLIRGPADKASSSTHGFPVYDNSAVAHWHPLHLAAEGRWRIADGGWRVEPQPAPCHAYLRAGQARQSAASGGDLTSFAGSAAVPQGFAMHQRLKKKKNTESCNREAITIRISGKQDEGPKRASEQLRPTSSAHTDSSLAAANSDDAQLALSSSPPALHST